MEGGLRGLLVVFSAMMIQVLAFGNYAIIGIYIIHLLKIFHGDAVCVSLISAVHFAALLGCGPLVSYLMTKVSYRKLCMAGAALVSLGIFCTPLIVSLPAMYVFFGVFAGIGGCLIYIPSHVLSGLYYDKYRSLAVGVASSGTALGGTVMPLVIGTLIDEYGWKGSLIVLAAIDTHLFIFAMFMVLPSDPTKHQNGSLEKVSSNIIKTKTMTTMNNMRISGTELCKNDVVIPKNRVDTQEKRWLADKGGGETSNTRQSDHLLAKLEESDGNKSRHSSTDIKPRNIPTRVSKSSEHVSNRKHHINNVKNERPSSFVFLVPSDNINRILVSSYPLRPPFWINGTRSTTRTAENHKIQESNITKVESYTNSTNFVTPTNNHTKSRVSEEIGNSYHETTDSYSSSKFMTPTEKQTISSPVDCDTDSWNSSNFMSPIDNLPTGASESISFQQQSLTIVTEIEGWSGDLKDHFKILCNIRFLVYCFSTIIWSLTTTLFLTFAPEVIVLKGFTPHDAAFLITFFGVGQLIGCIFISIFGNFFGNRILLFILSNVFTGIFMTLVPHMYSYGELATMLVLEGVAYGCILGLYMSVTIDLIGIHDLNIGFGFVMLYSGIGCFSGPPIGGAMSEVYGQYDEAFYASGLLTVVGGGFIMLLIYLPCCHARI